MLPCFGISIPKRIIFFEFSAWPGSVPAIKYVSVNTKQLLKSTLIVVGFFMMFSSAAYAQLREDLEVNVFGLGVIHSSKDYEISFPQSPTPIQGNFKFNKGLGGGFRVNVYNRGHWAEEAFFSYEPNVAQFTRVGTPSSTMKLSTENLNIGMNALYYLSDDETHNVRPFVTVGGGWAVFLLTDSAKAIVRDPLQGNAPDMNSANEIAVNFGGGVKAKVKRWLGVRVDLKGFISRNPSFGLARESNDPNATVFPAGGALYSGEASAGLVFYFGRH
jgi:outer membrane protein W